MISFAKKVKKELCSLNTKLKSCCGYSFIYGILYTAVVDNDRATVKILNSDVGELFESLCCQMSVKKEYGYLYYKNRAEISSEFLRFTSFEKIKKNVLKCAKCKEYFLRGIFLVNGNVSDPDKSYRLEMSFDKLEKAEEIFELLTSLGLTPLKTTRNGKYLLYYRKSELIEDFFANIGATSLAFDIMNSKINKELINNANRVTNCDSANINKSLKASNRYNTVILELIHTKKIDLLPEHLKEMALKRIEFKELSFSDLGNKFSPSISKSGVYHRLEKILDFYEEIKDKK